jgi:hypothetical protein
MPCGCVWWDVTRAPFACRYPSLVKQLLDIQVGKNKEINKSESLRRDYRFISLQSSTLPVFSTICTLALPVGTNLGVTDPTLQPPSLKQV